MRKGSKEYFEFLNRLENDPEFCFNYLKECDVKSETYTQCLKTISKNAKFSLKFAEETKKRFELGEEAISKDAGCSLYYARNIIQSRFIPGELAVSKNSQFSYLYARDIIRGRFELGEESISQDEEICYCYAVNVIKGKLPEDMHNVMLAKRIAA